MIRSRRVGYFLLSVLILAGCSKSSTTPTSDQPVADTRIASASVVKAAPQPVEIVAGDSAQSTIRLTIRSGYHINANPPTYSYLKATELDIPSSEGVSVAFISYPDPITRQLGFADKPIAVYEGETPLKVMLKADKAAKKGERSLPGKLRVQACDDQVCYPPGAVDLSIPVTIK